jgi:hypothetical protein
VEKEYMLIASNGTKTAPAANEVLAAFKSNDEMQLYGWLITAEEGNTFTLSYSTESGDFEEPIVLNSAGYAAVLSDTVPLTETIEGDAILRVDNASNSGKRYFAKLFYDREPVRVQNIINISKDALDAAKCV